MVRVRTLEFDATDLATVRFATSPVSELVWSTVALRKPPRWPHRAWRETVLGSLDGDFALLRAMTGGRDYAPDFLTPVPNGAHPCLVDELDRVAAVDPGLAVAQVGLIHPDRAPRPLREFVSDPVRGLSALVDQMREYFDRFLARHWSRLRAVCETDIAHRGALAASTGPSSMLAELHPRLAWDGTALATGHRRGPLASIGDRLVLVPTCFAWPGPHVTADPRPDTAIAYPPRGIGLLWDERPAAGPESVVALLGGSRAKILNLLAAARTTTEVAEILALAPSTASHHLTVLRDCGLITGYRAGRQVRYLRAPLGDRLIDAA
ncbi:MAG TPA: ArsR family transcriptional regulator [Stackebrandtia sp.]|uniref:ArsR/SmtB family transcription factor n=1 Tax=Stackebrandtia sp. TaxID=2023065 RepID=UPI002D3BCB90|nr:ArsR family transcriptional regulator [Stackebrandtia sp.]HZE40701.1 ArsR family transcriptional regulator [Stackebrandtia sp.]